MPLSEEPREDRTTFLLLAILGVALLLRLVVAVVWDPGLPGDAGAYDGLARRLLSGEGFVDGEGSPTSWRPPGYPFFLAAVYWAVGDGLALRLAQALLGTGVVGAVFLLGRAAAGPAVGLTAAGLVAVDPGQLASVSRTMSELLAGALLLVAVFSLLAVSRSRAPPETLKGLEDRLPGPPLVLAGVALGLATLTRGAFIGLAPLAAAAIVLRRRTRAALLGAAVLLVAWGGTLLPWTLRNAGVHDAFVPVTTQVGMTFYASQNPIDGHIFGILPTDRVTEGTRHLPEAERSDTLLAAGIETLADDPGRIPRLAVLKLLYLVVPLDWEVLPWYGAFNPIYAFVLLWATAGVAVLLRGRGAPSHRSAPPVPASELWPVWLPLLYLVAVALVFYGSPRLRLPFEPLLAVLAAVGLVAVGRALSRRALAGALAAIALPLLLVTLALEPLKEALRGLLSSMGLWS